jgi:hypothetical protein
MSVSPTQPAGLTSTESDIDPLVLAELTRALLPFLGPYSITTVKRASRSTSDPREAARIAALHIDDDAKRELFLKSAKRVLDGFEANHRPKTVAAPSAQQINTGGRPATPLTPELMKRGEEALAPIIGPLASVLVGRYAQVADNSRDFFEKLASHLRNTQERDTFFENIRHS